MTESTIGRFYHGRSVFITGATGFMGKVLVAKLVSSCPMIERLYLLMRPSSGKDINCRLQEFAANQVFDTLRDDGIDVLSKLTAVSGDILSPTLGLSAEDVQMLSDRVTVVFHLAARIKFDDDLRGAIDNNVKGPQKVVEFCRQLKNLQAFVHVSTVFNNLDKPEIAEEIYPPTLDPHKLLDLIDCMDNKLLASITKQLVGTCPNVYAYTKALGEQLLQKECNSFDIPLVIVRPSIVTASLKEPMPGWIDNINGPTGLLVGVGKGLLRVLKINPRLIGDLIPVDISVNLMIAAAWNRAMEPSGSKEIVVYNCSSGSLNPITWGQFQDIAKVFGEKYPTKEILWYPNASLRIHPLMHNIEIAIFHYLPAYILDFIIRICGKKPFLVRLYDKAHRAMSCLEFYSLREWHFTSKNPTKLLEKMSADDRRIFDFDVRNIDWSSYIETYLLGIRRFVLKDDISSVPEAKKKLKIMYRVKVIFRLVLIAVMLFLFYSIIQHSLDFFDYFNNTARGSNDTYVLPLDVSGQPNAEKIPVILENIS